jgi:hypothetical protein
MRLDEGWNQIQVRARGRAPPCRHEGSSCETRPVCQASPCPHAAPRPPTCACAPPPQFNLADFTRRAYGTNYVETLRVTIHANARIRRVYFSDRLYSEEETPPEFKLFVPVKAA